MTILTKIVNIKYNVDVLSPNFLSPLQQHGGGNGGLRYCSIKLFSSGILVNWILKCGIAVSLTPSVCLRLFFILLDSVKENPSQYCGTVLLSNARQYF